MLLRSTEILQIGKAIMRLLLIALVTTVIVSQGSAQTIVDAKTASGCRLKSLLGKDSAVSWDGSCVNGLAQGVGTVVEKNETFTFTRRIHFHEGVPLGYAYQTLEVHGPFGSKSEPAWHFYGVDGNSIGSFSGSVGLTLGGDPVARPIEPSLSAISLQKGSSIYVNGKQVEFNWLECSIYLLKGTPAYCDPIKSGGVGKRLVYHLREVKAQQTSITLCPDPYSPAGCEAAFEEKVRPLREELVNNIRQLLPSVGRSVAVGQALLLAEQKAASEERTRSKEREAAVDAAMDSMSVGQLFAVADELEDKGELARARRALRTLIARFPDHPLSTAAAAQLSKLSNTSTQSAAPPSKTSNPNTSLPQSSHSEVSGNGNCRSNLAFLGSRIPTFTAAELQAGRNSVLNQSVTEAIAGAKQQGYSSESALKATFAQAREFDSVSRQAAACAADVDAMGTTDEQFLAAMQRGMAPLACSGIRNSCLCASIVNRLAALGVRALAAEMQCFARSGRW